MSLVDVRGVTLRSVRLYGFLGLLVVVCVVALGSTSAMASTCGLCGVPSSDLRGVAVDQESDDVYVVDRGNNRVDELDSTGALLRAWGWGVADGTTHALQSCTSSCHAGLPGSGAGQFEQPEGVAVDNSPGLSPHDVYVVDRGNHRVEKFTDTGGFLLMFGGEVNKTTKGDVCLAGQECQAGVSGTANGRFELGFGDVIAVGSTGTVYVGDLNRVQEFTSAGVYQSQVSLSSAGHTEGLAVNAAGDLYVISEKLSGVREYEPSGTLVRTVDAAGEPKALTVAPSGGVIMSDGTSAAKNYHLLEYGSAGEELASFDAGMEDGARGIDFQGASTVGVLGKETVRSVPLPPGGPLIVNGSESAVPGHCVVLYATVNPEGLETAYHFQFGTSMSYGSRTPTEALSGGGFEDQEVSGELCGLSPGTAYHYRLVAENTDGTALGQDHLFTTPPVTPAIVDESVSGVTEHDATLEAMINPGGQAVRYQFQVAANPDEFPSEMECPPGVYWAPFDGCDGTVVASALPIGFIEKGSTAQPVSLDLAGVGVMLAPNTTYHYRVLVTRSVPTEDTIQWEGLPVYGVEVMFTTPESQAEILGRLLAEGAPAREAERQAKAAKEQAEAAAASAAAKKKQEEEAMAAAKKKQEEEAAATKKGEAEKTKPKTLTRSQKLTKILRACKKESKMKRAQCEKQAHKKYGTAGKRASRRRR